MDTQKNNKGISRRTFIKTAAVAAAGSSAYACSNGEGLKIYADEAVDPIIPPVTGHVFYGATPHNCGGGCLNKYYVDKYNNKLRVRRIVSDEDREDGAPWEGKAQFRSCPKCKSRTSWWYRSDRLKYPLKRPENVERGDVKNYIKVSWEQAIKEIVAKQAQLIQDYGNRSIMCAYASGDRSYQSSLLRSAIGSVGNGDGSVLNLYHDFSFPQYIQTYWFVDYEQSIFFPQVNFYYPNVSKNIAFMYRQANGIEDIKNSDRLVLWSLNPAETRMGTQTILFMKEAKEKANLKMTVIDVRYTMTATAFADKFIGPVAGTDAAMVVGMIHHMITDTWAADGSFNPNGLLLRAWRNDPAFLALTSGTDEEKLITIIKSYVHGFFDDPVAANATYYHNDMKKICQNQAGLPDDIGGVAISYNPLAYIVPTGASFSAYIMGADNRLVLANTRLGGGKLNSAVSIYPNTIGYNVAAGDPLYDKATNCYGKSVKDVHWAEKITGVSAVDIIELAEIYCTQKVTTWHGAGVQRHSEGEQFCWMLPILCGITGNFGQKGRSYGFNFELDAGVAGTETASALANKLKTGSSADNALIGEVYNAAAVTSPATIAVMDQTSPYYRKSLRANAFTMGGLSVASWADALDNAGAGRKSKWNNGKINKSTGAIKSLWMFGGNPVCTQESSSYAVSVMKDKSKAELIVGIDLFMTPTIEHCDYILPARAAGEKWGISDSLLSSDSIIMQPVSTPDGEPLSEYNIARLIAKQAGKEAEFLAFKDSAVAPQTHIINNDKELAQLSWLTFQQQATQFARENVKETFNDLIQKGYYSARASNPGLVNVISKSRFRNNPSANPLATVSGKIEAYCQAIVEDYEAAYTSLNPTTGAGVGVNGNRDQRTGAADPLGGTIYTAFDILSAQIIALGEVGGNPADPTFPAKYMAHLNTFSTMRRFVYPIPMYIPCINGMHSEKADTTDTHHPDVLGQNTEYPFHIQTYHYLYRSHSTLNNVDYLNELYKKDRNGKPTFLSNNRDAQDGAWDDNVYEPAFINSEHARDLGIFEGDRIMVESKHARIYCSAMLTNTIAKHTVGIGDSGWYKLNSEGIDIGGCANALFSGRPTRIGFGMALGSDVRVKVTKR